MFVDLVLRVAVPSDLYRSPAGGRVAVVLRVVLLTLVCAGLAAFAALQRMPSQPINPEGGFPRPAHHLSEH